MKKDWKDILAYTIVTLVTICLVGVIGYALYLGGAQAFIMFISIFGIVVGGVFILLLIRWAFSRVFNS